MNRLLEYVALRPDLRRAMRASVAFFVPLAICNFRGKPVEGVFLAFTAQTIALPDLRGPYGTRLLILAAMTAVVAGSAFLGVCAGSSILHATLAMGLIALLGALWRHLSADYGPSLSVSSALLFLLGLARPGPVSTAADLAGLIVISGAGAALLHIVIWPFRPQHPLRNAVAETWVAASDLVAAMRPKMPDSGATASDAVPDKERALRATLDRTFVIIAAAENTQSPDFLRHLEECRREVVHFAMRFTAFHSAMESLVVRADFSRSIPTLDSVLKAAGDAARSAAVTLVSHRGVNFAATDVRLARCGHLVQVLDEHLAGLPPDVAVAHARAMIDQVSQVLPRIRASLEKTLDLGDSKSAFLGKLPELGKRSLHSLAAWINPSPEPDPALIRYAFRMATLAMGAVALYKWWNIPRGYWIAFTIIVVLQPDYGATRKKAGERIGGSIAGSLLGGLVLWIRMPALLLDVIAGLLSFSFAYFLKTRYGLAVLFVTLMLVVVTGATGPLHWEFMIDRSLCNLAGGFVALFAAVIFWPAWEGDKLTALTAVAVRANKTFLEAISSFLCGGNKSGHDLLMAKRGAENADRYAAESLHRMLAEPGIQNENSGSASALVTYNQRLTRALTAIAVHLHGGLAIEVSPVCGAIQAMGEALESLAMAVEKHCESAAVESLQTRMSELKAAFDSASFGKLTPAGCLSPEDLVWTHLAKGVTEIRAMTLAMGGMTKPE